MSKTRTHKVKSYAGCRVLRLYSCEKDYRTTIYHPSFGAVCQMIFPKDAATFEFAKKAQHAMRCLIELEAQEEQVRGVKP